MNDLLKEIETLSASSSSRIPDTIWAAGREIINSSYIPQLTFAEDRPVEEKDFEQLIPNIVTNLKALRALLKTMRNSNVHLNVKSEPQIAKNFAVPMILLCGEQASENKWTSIESINIAMEVIELLVNIFGHKSLSEFLTSEGRSDLLTIAFNSLRPKLLKDTWRQYPGGIACYKWLLINVKSPYLGDHLGEVLPTALILVDDFQVECQISGVDCLRHIIDNVTRTEICWFGRSDVIFDALKRLLQTKEPELMVKTVLCISTLLTKVEGSYLNEDKKYEFSRYDEVLQIILPKMEMEQSLALRRSYAEVLGPFMEAMNLPVVRWTKSLLRIFQEYLMMADVDTVMGKNTLLSLKMFLRIAWPRVPSHCEEILLMLLKLLYIKTRECEEKTVPRTECETLVLIEECLVVLVKIAPDDVRKHCSEVNKLQFNEHFHSVLQRICSDMRV